ncbi:MAG: XdhC family protein [Pseudomonadota bacterium]
MACGGTAQVFVEVHGRLVQLVLVGAGHVNLQLAKMANEMFGFACIVVDDRADWANERNYPNATVLNLLPAEAFEKICWTEDTIVVIATRGHEHDYVALRAAVERLGCYIGVVASKRKAQELINGLVKDGVNMEEIRLRLHTPIGLDLGGKSPAEIALSIMAEIQMVRHNATGKPMRVGS